MSKYRAQEKKTAGYVSYTIVYEEGQGVSVGFLSPFKGYIKVICTEAKKKKKPVPCPVLYKYLLHSPHSRSIHTRYHCLGTLRICPLRRLNPASSHTRQLDTDPPHTYLWFLAYKVFRLLLLVPQSQPCQLRFYTAVYIRFVARRPGTVSIVAYRSYAGCIAVR